MKLLVTGGAGFIGSALVRMLVNTCPEHSILNLDKLTYAGNLENLREVANNPRYAFVNGDIADQAIVEDAISTFRPDAILHLAAESHVDRSILSPLPAFETNLRGTLVLLEAARKFGTSRFIHVSTDEVYGSLQPPARADEGYPLAPSSPYSASKAGSDMLALSYYKTYGLPVCVTRASNNYGPYQFPEKLIPLMISNALEYQPLPVYGDGLQIRDWIYVDDHCRGILAVLGKGKPGEIYNIGGPSALPNIDVVHKILAATKRSPELIRGVQDRPGHDRRYAIASEKIEKETGWTPIVDFDSGLAATVRWYVNHRGWIDRVKSGEYRNFYSQNYGSRVHVQAGAA